MSFPLPPPFPFVAIIGQEELKLGLLLAAIDPAIGGVMIMGHRGTGKSTTVRALADLMPPIEAVLGCPYHCPLGATAGLCGHCSGDDAPAAGLMPVPVVDLPLGATEDRVVGTLDIEHALVHGRRHFEPGLLASANRGFLYIDEVNLLEDHLVDLLLDVAASGVNVVEREGISVRHPARFSLVGSGNPEEGELRPQLVDRFGLHVWVETENDPTRRVEIVRRRMAFDDNPVGFRRAWEEPSADLRARLDEARRHLEHVVVGERELATIARLAIELGIDGHRGELVMARAARAHAAFERRVAVDADDLRVVAPMALRHRLRKDPLATSDPGSRIGHLLDRILGGMG